MAVFNEDKEIRKIEELRRQEEEDLALLLSKKYNVGYADLTRMSINTDALRLIKEGDARESNIAAFGMVGKKLSVAVKSPENQKAKDIVVELEKRGFAVELYMVSMGSLERAYERYKDLSFATETKAGILDISSEEIHKLLNAIKSLPDAKAVIEDLLKQKKIFRISRILETVLAGGLSTDASDIHIEPEEAYVRLRYRLDGVLTDVLTFDRETYQLLLSRIKLLSGLKLNIKDAAQDGRFSVKIEGSDIEIRTSILPGAYGESIVLRLLDPNTIGVPMEELGIEEKLRKILEKEIRKPNGMVLNTGPTGSGKTTTLYAFMKKIHTPDIKIVTIEDPIEYHLPGIVQTQVEPKSYTFAQGLRSVLRQDPDIIMVGEIRDEEVAEVAINSSLTGHLVFSTLHTNDAAGAFPRLIDLGINPKIIGSAINVVMAQRLVRRLCECRKETTLSEADQKLIEEVLKGVVDQKLLPENKTTAYEAVGCEKCNNTGYKGRIGIFEAILMDKGIEDTVAESASEREIVIEARRQGLLSMKEDGVLKVLAGVTTLSELERVIEIRE